MRREGRAGRRSAAAGWLVGAALVAVAAIGSTRVEGAARGTGAVAGAARDPVAPHPHRMLRPPVQVRRASAAGAPSAFGAAVALGRDRAFVGAPRGGRGGAGSVHVYGLGGAVGGSPVWSGSVRDPDGMAGDRFGATVVAAGDALLVGAPRASRASTGEPLVGQALVYVGALAGGQAPTARLDPPVGIGPAGFGAALAAEVVGGTAARIAVGAPSASTGGVVASGAVALYGGAPSGWSLAGLRGAPGGPATARSFGAALAFVGDTLIVGAPGDGAVAPGAGRVYGFAPDGVLRFELALDDVIASATPADIAGGRFGSSIAAVDDRAVAIGAPGRGLVAIVPVDPDGVVAIASAEVLRGGAAAGFGVRLAAARAALFVSAPWSQPGAPGEVVELRPDGPGGWRIVSRHRRPGPQGSAVGTEFGIALAAAGGRLLVGEPSASDPGVAGPAGAAHLFRMAP